MGKLSIEFCDYCKKVGSTEEVFLVTDRAKRSTESNKTSLHLCEDHLLELKTYFESFRKYSNLDLANLVLSTKSE